MELPRSPAAIGSSLVLCLLGFILPAFSEAQAQNAGLEESPSNSPRVREALLLTIDAAEGNRRRFRGLNPDPIQAKLVDGTLASFQPSEGEALPGLEDSRWKKVELSEEGETDERGFYLDVPVELKEAGAFILSTTGRETFVNGVPRCGNVYGYDYVDLPVALRKGSNHILLRAGRRLPRVTLEIPPAPVSLSDEDKTLPDLLAGETSDTWGAVIVRNATQDWARGFTLAVEGSGFDATATPIPDIAPMSMRKAGFRIRCLAPQETGELPAKIVLQDPESGPCHETPTTFRIVKPDQTRRLTFVSDIDGSVQYYALRPAAPGLLGEPAPAIVLSCHGASVEGFGQAAAYGPKRWFHIVAPTNRRPYGFDWEDFGRMDAMEVLAQAKDYLKHDPSRIYVTGHSMGGHGAWHLAVTYPDQFAAVGPSAGWISRSTYGRRRRSGEEPSPLEKLIERSQRPSDTQALASNLKHQNVYILHGADDDNVPASQAHTMAETLAKFHDDWHFHEEPGQGHWWSNEFGDQGSACVDWPFMFDSFARHARPPSFAVRHVEFATANPGISSQCHWLEIMQQDRHSEISKADLHLWPNKRQIQGTTENIALMKLDMSPLASREPLSLEIDGQSLTGIAQPERYLYLERAEGEWRVMAPPSPALKGPHRYGGPKDVLKYRFLLVYGTQGTAEENDWAFQKARLDSETFWYRGNASVDLVPDTDFTLASHPDRSIVLYGNAQSNGAWSILLEKSPVQVNRDGIRLGERHLEGDDLSIIFVQPRPDSDHASVVVLAGSGLPGMRATFDQTLFVPFVRFPDCVVRRQGEAIAAGYFGNDWSVENGEFAFETP